MLRSMKELTGYNIKDTNNENVGKADDFYFDDLTWIVRYLIVNIGVWLPGKKVLISPVAIRRPGQGVGVDLPLSLTKQQIENAPRIDHDLPVSRMHEIQLAEHYQWPAYWTDVTFMDAHRVGMHPEQYLERMKEIGQRQEKSRSPVLEKTLTTDLDATTHLRSTGEVIGYHIHATDDDIGHVEDFIVDTATWHIRYMVVDTKNWWPGKKVLVSPAWIEDISWLEEKVYVGLTRQTIKNSPEFDPSEPVNKTYETHLYDYYGRPKYWD